MTDERYNGWTNRETWLTNLWLTNDQNTHEFVIEQVFQGDATEEHEQEQILRGIVEEMVYGSQRIDENGWVCIGSGLKQDMLGHCLARVNFYEIMTAISEGLDEAAGETSGSEFGRASD